MRCIPAGCSLFLVALFAASVVSAPATAQPFDAWLTSTPGFPVTHGFIQVPHSAELNPTAALTFEVWINLFSEGPPGDCRSIAGKNWKEAWWVGVCAGEDGSWSLRSYTKGTPSLFTAGRVRSGQWQHLAVTDDGATRRHYINGELVGSTASVGPLGTSAHPLRILSDVQFEVSPRASLDEARLWSVARTLAQIRETINVRVTTAQPGLVAVWPLGNANDVVGTHDGVLMGTGVNALIAAVASTCGSQTETSLCLNDKFQVSARYRTGPPGSEDHAAMTIPCDVPLCEGSGIFWFFQDTNWELMVKSLNGCDITHHWWLFVAGLTNVHFRLEATDVSKGESKIYFNYPGPPAPAITDTLAFATCPPPT